VTAYNQFHVDLGARLGLGPALSCGLGLSLLKIYSRFSSKFVEAEMDTDTEDETHQEQTSIGILQVGTWWLCTEAHHQIFHSFPLYER
jgi:hypothetical protein